LPYVAEGRKHPRQVLVQRKTHGISESHRAKLPARPQDMHVPARNAEALSEFKVGNEPFGLIRSQ
jgi:hypothetical protein